MTLPDPGLSAPRPRPQPSPWCGPIENLGHDASCVRGIWHRALLAMHDTASVFGLDGLVERVWFEGALGACDTGLHATGDYSCHIDSDDRVDCQSHTARSVRLTMGTV